MVRIKRGTTIRAKHKKLRKLTKGMGHLRRRTVVKAHEALLHKDRDAYIGRKNRKRDLRRLWIVRINAASRMAGMSYSQFMKNLKIKNIDINRKFLAEMAFENPEAIKKLVEMVK
ncbi:MAG: 50S ribosomal protein L20 [Patescibacteria group bacterium]